MLIKTRVKVSPIGRAALVRDGCVSNKFTVAEKSHLLHWKATDAVIVDDASIPLSLFATSPTMKGTGSPLPQQLNTRSCTPHLVKSEWMEIPSVR